MWENLLSWLTGWASQFVIWSPSASEVARVIAACAGLMTLVQAIKRLIEWIERNPLLARILPKEVREAIGQLAHGWGARVLAAIVTLATVVPAIVQDGSVTAAEAINVLVALLGAMGLYELIRGRVGLLFPKRG